jgi:hypothetical protein
MRPVYDPAIADWLNSPKSSLGDKAVACNLRHDQRISPPREASVDNYRAKGVRPNPRTGAALKGTINDYFRLRIQTSFHPDYIIPNLNENNFVPLATAANPDGVNPSRRLVRVLDLSRLRAVYRWAFEQGLPDFLDFDPSPTDVALGRWLGDHLSSRSGPASFVNAVLDAIDRRRRKHPYEPSWAVWWRDFKPFINRPAEHWLEILGLENRHSDELPHSLILLKYRVGEIRTLVRPTQLDAGWFRFHFPSPLQKDPCACCGYPMDLSIPPPHRKLLPEFIHQQIPHAGHWTGHIKQTHGARDGRLNDQRHAHHERLKYSHPELRAGGWIEECL